MPAAQKRAEGSPAGASHPGSSLSRFPDPLSTHIHLPVLCSREPESHSSKEQPPSPHPAQVTQQQSAELTAAGAHKANGWLLPKTQAEKPGEQLSFTDTQDRAEQAVLTPALIRMPSAFVPGLVLSEGSACAINTPNYSFKMAAAQRKMLRCY